MSMAETYWAIILVYPKWGFLGGSRSLANRPRSALAALLWLERPLRKVELHGNRSKAHFSVERFQRDSAAIPSPSTSFSVCLSIVSYTTKVHFKSSLFPGLLLISTEKTSSPTPYTLPIHTVTQELSIYLYLLWGPYDFGAHPFYFK